LTTLCGCRLACMDRETGMPRQSQTMKDAVNNKVFQFEMGCNVKTIKLYNGKVLTIKNAWVENNWEYECFNNKPVIKIDTSLHLIIDYNNKEFDNLNYCVFMNNNDYGCCLGGVLVYKYLKQDTLVFNIKGTKESFLNNTNSELIETIKFYKTYTRQ